MSLSTGPSVPRIATDTSDPLPPTPIECGALAVPAAIALAVVVVAIVAIVRVTNEVLEKGPTQLTSTDVVAIISPVIGAISTIAATFFGVSAGVTAGQVGAKQSVQSERAAKQAVVTVQHQAGQAIVNEMHARMATARQLLERAQYEQTNARSRLQQASQDFGRRFDSPAGSGAFRYFTFQPQIDGPVVQEFTDNPFDVPLTTLADISSRIEAATELLGREI